MLRFSHTFNAELRGVGNLLKISVPIIRAEKPQTLRIDHVWWSGHFIHLYAEIATPGLYVKPDDIHKKYKVFVAPKAQPDTDQ